MVNVFSVSPLFASIALMPVLLGVIPRVVWQVHDNSRFGRVHKSLISIDVADVHFTARSEDTPCNFEEGANRIGATLCSREVLNTCSLTGQCILDL